MKEKLAKLKSKSSELIKKSYEIPLWKWLVVCFVIAICEEFLLEMLGRRSIITPFVFIFHNPYIFIYNILIVYFTLCIALLFRRRGFMMGLVSLIWFVFGFANFMVLGYRITPFSAIDLLMVSDVFSMLNIYFNVFQRILIFVGLALLVVIVVIAFIKIPKIKGKIHYIPNIIVCLVMFIIVYTLTIMNVEMSIISDKFTNLGNAYKDYGFAYCFSNSIIDVGIDKPDDYSEENIDTIYEDIKDIPDSGSLWRPDIIIIQLESFIDIDRVEGVNTDIDSIPNFHKYQEEYPSGFFTVPAIGAGTANTEFEVITGMRSKLFGAGEYPYKTVLTDTPCESMAQLLLNQGYGTHAIHNNKAKFYSRDESYASLGFQTFTSLEYMQDFNRTETGWAKDDCLPDEIIKALDCDKEKDLVFTISVQGHGRYPKDELKCEEHVKVTLDSEDPELTNQFGYYVNQCYEMDEMIADLKQRLDERGEDYVLFLYGDHIPSLTFDNNPITVGEMDQTEYVIVSNFRLNIPDQDLYAYEVSDLLMGSLYFNRGIMQRCHNKYFNREDTALFDEVTHNIQYDILYGDGYMYDNIPMYQRQDMKLGIDDILVDSVEYKKGAGTIIVRGHNFTEFSTILINDERQETVFVDNNTLMILKENVKNEPLPGDVFCVAQIDKDKHELTRTEEMFYAGQ